MADKTITVGSRPVLMSGSIIAEKGEMIEIPFGSPPDMTLRFKFTENAEVAAQSMSWEVGADQKSLTGTLTNFTSPLGTGLKEKMQIALVNDRPVFLQFCVFGLGDIKHKLLQYTITLGETANVTK